MTRSIRRSYLPRLIAAVALVASAAPAHPQPGCQRIVLAGAARDAAAPPGSGLDASLTLRSGAISLRTALDRVAALARVRVSYSGDAYDLDRLVCVDFDAVPLRQALRALLGDAVEPVVAGADHVVLTPAAQRIADATVAAPTVIPLEPVLVIGAVSALDQREIPFSRTIVSGRDLVASGARDLSKALAAASPGIWAWSPSPLELSLRYGSVRGASSFGSTYPKVYVDGVELANPLLLARLTPEAIERIEVIRGPQGAALYGSEAISGVINIVTRQHAVGSGAPRLSLRAGAGFVSSDFVPGGSLAHDHVLTLEGGRPSRSARLNLSAGSSGAFVPGASNRFFGFDGSGRIVGSSAVLTTTARISSDRSAPGRAALSASYTPDPAAGSTPQEVPDRGALRYTLGTRVSVAPSAWATHALVIGLDGYNREGLAGELGSAGDSPFEAVADAALRASVRASSNIRLVDLPNFAATLTVGAEQSLFREEILFREVDALASAARIRSTSWQKSSGLLGLVEASLFERVHLTGGLRLEVNDGFSAGGGFETLPMLGASTTWERGAFALKIRSAFGSGIRPAGSAVRGALAGRLPQPNLFSLAPERQVGFESGLDLTHSSGASLSMTRFQQVASGLIQETTVSPLGEPDVRRPAFPRLQNVGEVGNQGWEAEAALASGPIRLAANLTAIDSRVRSLAGGYSGELRAGDRMLEVPAQTAAFSAAWVAPRLTATVTLSKAWNWINYDRRRMLADGVYQSGAEAVGGDLLREYWRRYDGTPSLDATIDLDVRRNLALLVRAENLFDRQLGEPDNVTILPGRTLSIGFRASY